ncbi:restriction endonuclease [Neisseria sp. ZJ106]|uniref:DpnI domain-containing protein n=1 Tax=Neisseria lisongii TaxID=2912188 RepID=A0ABY7RLG6_9NEIS|nr:DpnI domain-containing protein [Neisseria lisongii]MCF7520917.1 restriction endonuclease [Neisseria lisongii]WCL72479.1 DpnI domain-containing protein [Neisseria lisongii]
MNLRFNTDLIAGYRSPRQIIRRLSEDWLAHNGYCPNCGNRPIQPFANNTKVGDFFCTECNEQFELKSKSGLSTGKKIPDGAYNSMIARIQAEDNPNFLFLAYKKADYSVQQLILVPKHFVNVKMIVPRNKPLKNRENYLMCDMDISSLPESGKILLVDQARMIDPGKVRQQWQSHLFMRQQQSKSKGWLLAIMKCIDQLPEQFDLRQMYVFEQALLRQFPENRHIKEKIRQQLQILRNHGVIEFSNRGKYRKVKP